MSKHSYILNLDENLMESIKYTRHVQVCCSGLTSSVLQRKGLRDQLFPRGPSLPCAV